MAIRNNVTRMLDSKKIPYSIFELPSDEKLGAVEVAEILGLPAEQVFKTLVAKRISPGKGILALVPGPADLDLKALARNVGEKKVKMTTQREAEENTGLQAGGISALALLHKPFQVVIDESALRFDQIYISGGQRGLDIGLAPNDLIEITQGITAPIQLEVRQDQDTKLWDDK